MHKAHQKVKTQILLIFKPLLIADLRFKSYSGCHKQEPEVSALNILWKPADGTSTARGEKKTTKKKQSSE